MKKLFAILLVIAMAIPGAVYAAEPGWTINYNGTSDRATHYARISTDYHYEGISCIEVGWNPATDAGVNVELKNTLREAAPAGSYVFKYHARGRGTPQIKVGNQVVEGFTPVSVTDNNDTVSDWKVYSNGVVLTDAVESVSFTFNTRTAQHYDFVSFVNTETGEEYIVDGGFEDYTEPEAPDVPYDRSGYAVKHLRASSKGSNALAISWINPTTTDLAGISIYDITGGKNELVEDGLDTTPGESVYHIIPDLSTGLTYQYKVLFDFGAKGVDTYFVHGTPSSSITTQRGSWGLGIWRNGKANFCPGETVIDTTTAFDGNASLKISINADETARFGADGTALKDNIYCKATQTLNLTDGKYKVSFHAKAENMMVPSSDGVSGPRVTMDFADFEGVTLFLPKPENDWIEYVYIYDYDLHGKDILTLTFNRICDGWWIDDIKVYKYNEETGSTVGDNLVSDGSFENLVSTSAGTVTGVTATPGVGSVTLSDFEVTGSYNELGIYQMVSGNYEYRGTIAADVTSIEIDNLKKGADVTFQVMPVNSDGVMGTPKDNITARTILPEYEIGEAVLYNDLDQQITELSGTGDYAVKIPVNNNNRRGGLPFDGIAALYKDGALVKVTSASGRVRKGIPEDIEIPVEITEAGNYTLEFYLIDSRDNLANYCKAFTWSTPVSQ